MVGKFLCARPQLPQATLSRIIDQEVGPCCWVLSWVNVHTVRFLNQVFRQLILCLETLLNFLILHSFCGLCGIYVRVSASSGSFLRSCGGFPAPWETVRRLRLIPDPIRVAAKDSPLHFGCNFRQVNVVFTCRFTVTFSF